VTTPSDREVVVTRVFDAPRQLVFDAHTRPDLIKKWLTGPPGWSMPVCTVDLRVGGKYRYEWKGPAGEFMAMGGVHREIDAPARLVATQLFDEDWTGGEALSSIDLAEKDGRTTLVQTVTYASKEARDGALRAGMTTGMEMSYASLDALLAKDR
jgi:uncharacterized protein YndB with AHSA1/START domain